MHCKKVLFIISLITSFSFGQTKDTLYSLTTEAGIGFSKYITTMDYNDLNKFGFVGSLRVMWNPEHLLSVGIETGYHYLYSIDVSDYSTEFGNTDFSASMYTVPVLFAFIMKLTPEIKISAGTGIYLLFNSGSLFSESLESNQTSIGGYAGASYVKPLNELISIGGELKYSYISKIQDQAFSIQFLLVYNFLQW